MSITLVARRAMMAASVASLVVTAQLDAQQTDRVMESGRTPRRYIFPFVGAAVGGLASLVYFWSGPRTLPGTCAKSTCVAAFSLGGGAFIGWLVGKEKDQLHELRYRGGRPLRPDASSVNITGDPIRLTANGSVVAALGTGGVHVISVEQPRLIGTRAAGLRNVNAAAISQTDDELALTATGGLYKFPLGTGQGTLLRGPPATAVTIVGTDYLIGAGTRVERVRRSSVETATYPGVEIGDTVHALKTDPRGGVVWAVTATELLALRPAGDSLAVVSRTRLPRGATNVDVEGNLAAVALSDSGVRFLDVTSPEAPKTITDWRGSKFVHDVALANGRAFVAAGMDGVAVVSLNGSTAVLEGLARELGLIVAVVSSPPYIFALDRSGSTAVRRIQNDPPR